MNTILTDDELPPLQPHDHPEPHSFAWTEQEMRAIRARDRLVEAAVLAKLREQEPFNIETEAKAIGLPPAIYAHPGVKQLVKAALAAPLPAVVQVPQGLIEAVDRVLEEAHCDCPHRLRFDKGQHLSGCPLFDLNVARLEMLAAPLPAVVQVPRIDALWGLFNEHNTPMKTRDAVLALLAGALRQEASDRSQLPQEWRDTIQGAIDELPYQHHLIPRLTAMLAAAPEAPAQADPLEKLTRIQEELRLYDDKPAQGECDAKPGPMSIARMACAIDGETRYAYQEIQNLVKTINYMVGIAERGRGVRCPSQEAPERFLLNYVKELEAAAPAQPSVPAPWREAMKVAREALDWCVAEINRDSPAVKNARPVIAQLDALEGGK